LLRPSEHRVAPDRVHSIPDDQLPIYTVLVPMYKEPAVAQKIARTVTSLDYPLEKLDVKLLLEEDDAPTRAKIAEVIDSLPKCVEVVIAPTVPKGQPRTKPRACNWGLERAKGELLVVFDAEDQPEPDQLRKAAYTFKQLELAGKKSVVCLQAKLNYFNARQNSLTRFFTLEYTSWFDLFLPGLHAVRTPIPLGGTSNHFRTSALRELGGWDPFNVTEDCDLGIRMARRGYSTEILDSTTWEEANSQLFNWIKQRSRWIKGYFQTHLVHTRESVVPMALMATMFYILFDILRRDLAHGVPKSIETIVKGLAAFCLIVAVVCVCSAVYSALQRLRQRAQHSSEGHLNPWHALTFRFTVGGLSAMLLLNLVFWVLTSLYLTRETVAAHLPNAVGNIKVDSTTTFRQSLAGWKMYYDEVVDDKYSGTTFWSTLAHYMSQKEMTWSEVSEHIRAIDSWSLSSQLIYPVAIMLFVANGIFVLLGLLSCHKRGLWGLFPVYAMLVPFYWVLISIAACKGFYQLFTNPWYWEKTEHGLTHLPGPPLPPNPPPLQQMETAAGE
jgi:cellulose synthase/poly-beta-1,6-N-acetylglucosamine synthase-like glycosyltransferase